MTEVDNTLRELFLERDSDFSDKTNQIIGMIPNVMIGIINAFKLQNENLSNKIVWEEFNLTDHEDGITYVVVMGSITYDPGDSFVLVSGETRTVKDQYKRWVHIGIPYEMAIEGTSSDIESYLISNMANSKETQIPPPQIEQSRRTDFDLDELSEEQRRALWLFESTQGGNNN